ncbi:hypothetical protein GWK47_017565 [Chionoecetes opilio]|uniref:HAT C-terminal dimerisation domain-containing protein n=1 Tax=Chionoecetes opilio TaxID=41210 RepID=A0A8J5CJ14_CHIOP|nr:hypothetical protein GWK47_017565 [Chionoecetes opilio]
MKTNLKIIRVQTLSFGLYDIRPFGEQFFHGYRAGYGRVVLNKHIIQVPRPPTDLQCCAHSHLPVIFLLILKRNTSTSSTAAPSWALVMEGVVGAIVIKMRQRSDSTKLFARHEGWRFSLSPAVGRGGEKVLIDLFLRYNTAMPSSAAVERLFSFGKDINRAKRSSLSDENFNMLMFMKGNMLQNLSVLTRGTKRWNQLTPDIKYLSTDWLFTWTQYVATRMGYSRGTD